MFRAKEQDFVHVFMVGRGFFFIPGFAGNLRSSVIIEIIGLLNLEVARL